MTDFSAHEDKLFMDKLKRRAYMLAFPDSPVVAADEICIKARHVAGELVRGPHPEDDYEVYEEFGLHVGKKIAGGDHDDAIEGSVLARFLNEFFGVEHA